MFLAAHLCSIISFFLGLKVDVIKCPKWVTALDDCPLVMLKNDCVVTRPMLVVASPVFK